MVLGFLRKLLLVVAGVTLGLGAYAEFTADTELRLTVLSILAVLVAAAYALGLFRRRPTEPPRPKKPAIATAEAAQTVTPPPVPQEEQGPEADQSHSDDDELYIVFARLAGCKTGDAFRAKVDQIVADNRLAPLSPDDITRLAHEIDRRDLRGKSFVRTPGIALVRLQRFDLDVEFGGTSWLGGLPTLADTPWPRDEAGRAMHHLAQIDLGTIPDPMLPKGMPTTGAMAFFLTTTGDGPYRGKVIYLPRIGNMATEPPEDLAPIYDGPAWGQHVKGYSRDNAPDTFPRWPVEFVLLPMADQNKDDDAQERMADLLPHQASGPLSAMNYQGTLPDFAQPFFWDTAHRFTMSVRLARDDLPQTIAQAEKRVQEHGASCQPALETLRTDADAFSQFVDEVSIWAVANGPWDRMTQNDVAALTHYFSQVGDIGGPNARFRPFYQFTQGELHSIEETTTATLVAAANESPEVFARLPFEVRDDIDSKYRIATKGRWHQMFGLGTKMKSAGSHHTYHHLLLQLHSDQLVNWMWGSGGVVQFWITEDDLMAQNWDAVDVTVESD